MRKEKKTHGTDSGPMAFGGFTSAALASLPPRISAVYDTACRTFARVGGTWDGVRAATANLLTSQARPLVDLVRRPIRVLSSILVSFPPPVFASCAAPRSARPSLSSQWPILHHRWGRQKGETTARLLFGETRRSVQLSERRGREGERERRKDRGENVICLDK